jgi:hypothetical protein
MVAMDFREVDFVADVLKRNSEIAANNHGLVPTKPRFMIPVCEEAGHIFMVTEWEKDESSEVANVLLCQRCMGLYKYKEMKQRMRILDDGL